MPSSVVHSFMRRNSPYIVNVNHTSVSCHTLLKLKTKRQISGSNYVHKITSLFLIFQKNPTLRGQCLRFVTSISTRKLFKFLQYNYGNV